MTVDQSGQVDKSAQRVKRMFGEIAPKYDLMNHVLSLNVDRYWRWRTCRLVRPSGDQPILDLCQKTGDSHRIQFRDMPEQAGIGTNGRHAVFRKAQHVAQDAAQDQVCFHVFLMDHGFSFTHDRNP